MLTRNERGQVEASFADALSEQANPRDLINTIFLAHAAPILLDLPTTMSQVPEIAGFVVGSCLDSEWSKNPALLDLLLQFLIDRRGQAQFDAVLTRVRQRIDPNPSLYDSVWMSGQRPFFNRGMFRQRIRVLVGESGRPILRITPVPDSYGRTYGTRFLEHLAEVLPGSVNVVAVELSPGTGPSYKPEDLAEAVAAQLGLDDAAPARTGSSYPKAVALWILRFLMKRPGRWLIVLDGFGQKGLNDEVRETIEALAGLVPTGQYRLRVRLVLVDYAPELPGVTPADTLEEILEPATAITRSHLEVCLQEWNAAREASGEESLLPGQLVTVAEGMMALAPAAGKERLATLNLKLIKLHGATLQEILGGTSGGG